jgi:hypothetical protein
VPDNKKPDNKCSLMCVARGIGAALCCLISKPDEQTWSRPSMRYSAVIHGNHTRPVQSPRKLMVRDKAHHASPPPCLGCTGCLVASNERERRERGNSPRYNKNYGHGYSSSYHQGSGYR